MRILSTIHPTENQKRIIALTYAESSPRAANDQIKGSSNMITARNMLAKLGILTYTDDSLELTDAGHKLAQDENIVDESGQLTDEGNILVYGQQSQAAPSPPADQLAGSTEPISLESFVLMKELLNDFQ